MKHCFALFMMLYSIQAFTSLNLDHVSAFSMKKKVIETLSFKNSDIPTVVIFLSKDCPCSKGNLDYINQLSLNFKNIRFIGIHSKKNSSNDDVLAYLQDKKLNFDIYNDSDLKVADMFGALKTPHAFIISKNGDVLYAGGVSSSTFPQNAKEFYLKDALTNHTNNQKITKTETRTLGCFIQR